MLSRSRRPTNVACGDNTTRSTEGKHARSTGPPELRGPTRSEREPASQHMVSVRRRTCGVHRGEPSCATRHPLASNAAKCPSALLYVPRYVPWPWRTHATNVAATFRLRAGRSSASGDRVKTARPWRTSSLTPNESANPSRPTPDATGLFFCGELGPLQFGSSAGFRVYQCRCEVLLVSCSLLIAGTKARKKRGSRC